ncbi:MAG: hypothetical protein JXQ73_31355 [Phycisphaerae bacterium]|nr:hypothetical protein [Phycisphaerae bacterium]
MSTNAMIRICGWLVALLLLLTWLAGSGPAQAQAGPPPIRWKAEGEIPEPEAPIEKDPGVILSRGAARHTVVQLDKIPTADERAALESSGVTLLRYLGSNAFFAKVTAVEQPEADTRVALARSVGVSSAMEVRREWKLPPCSVAAVRFAKSP